jgi:hypothetical protein
MISMFIAFLYLTGCMQSWVLARNSEALVSLITRKNLEIIPWQKTIATALWPLSAIYQFLIMLDYGQVTSSSEEAPTEEDKEDDRLP